MKAVSEPTVSVVDSADVNCPEIKVVNGAGKAKVVMWPGTGAKHRTMHLIDLQDGAGTVPFQHGGESVYYVIAGRGAVRDLAADSETALDEGAMVHIEAGDRYAFRADAGTDLRLVGGPCPADTSLYETMTGGR